MGTVIITLSLCWQFICLSHGVAKLSWKTLHSALKNYPVDVKAEQHGQFAIFTYDHNAPCLPPQKNFTKPLFPISPGYYSLPKRNRRQWLCKILGGKQGALWSM